MTTTLVILSIFLCFFVSPHSSHADDSGYTSIAGPCHPEFPKDHGAHPGYRTEWWYYTGNVHGESGERFGFQLTFFRRQLSPPGAEKEWPKPGSAWRTQQLFLAHAALSDIGGKHFYHAEQMARGALGLAGVRSEAEPQSQVTVFLKDWAARLGPSSQSLEAKTDDFGFSLSLIPGKDPVLHGESGYSLKGRMPESASCYYSFTRLEVQGDLALKGKTIPVHGTAWMDHEFSSAALEPDLMGWDWLSLQFEDRTELMIYLLRRKDGTYSTASAGTFVDASGKITHLDREAIRLEVTDHWKSPHSRASYPAGWKLRIDSLQLDVAVVPNLEDQEMQTQETTDVTYWEGSVTAKGSVRGKPVSGEGYVELTGYAKPLDAPL